MAAEQRPPTPEIEALRETIRNAREARSKALQDSRQAFEDTIGRLNIPEEEPPLLFTITPEEIIEASSIVDPHLGELAIAWLSELQNELNLNISNWDPNNIPSRPNDTITTVALETGRDLGVDDPDLPPDIFRDGFYVNIDGEFDVPYHRTRFNFHYTARPWPRDFFNKFESFDTMANGAYFFQALENQDEVGQLQFMTELLSKVTPVTPQAATTS